LKKINSALISVYNKQNLDKIVEALNANDIKIYSTGGTYKYIQSLGVKCTSVENITTYPSILGGRVKTLHPKIFGGILSRRDNEKDKEDLKKYNIPEIDIVIVDLYPFEETIKNTDNENEIIEKIDIGGISLIRAAAKNHKDVLIISESSQYNDLINLLNEKKGYTSLEDRKYFAIQAFNVSSHYDNIIFNHFNKKREIKSFKQSINKSTSLRYGENPHQKGIFYGDISKVFKQLHGKTISYNNLIDLDSAISLIKEFSEKTFIILKHTNPCGCASRTKLIDAWNDALAGDPISAFGGVLITNSIVDIETAKEINKLFFEIILAPGYEKEAFDILSSKKNRIILQKKSYEFSDTMFKSLLNGVIEQTKDLVSEKEEDFKQVTKTPPKDNEIKDLIFANKIVKHTKSNAIILVKNKQLIGSGMGQTSRIDSLKHAIEKAENFNLDLTGSVMASDAFFPFSDSVELAHKKGITAVIQPGGSIRDKDSIDYCNSNDMCMIFTGIRHFKH